MVSQSVNDGGAVALSVVLIGGGVALGIGDAGDQTGPTHAKNRLE